MNDLILLRNVYAYIQNSKKTSQMQLFIMTKQNNFFQKSLNNYLGNKIIIIKKTKKI